MRAVDWTLLASCLVLLIAGPAMALQEFVRAEEVRGLAEVTGEAPSYDAPFRGWWRATLLLTLLVGGVAGLLFAVRIAKQPRVRAVSGRLLGILLVGMTLFDLAFLADGQWFLLAPHEIRAVTIVWLYPLAAFLIGGATLRLIEVERVFGSEHRDALP